jgi:signal transduction histidine kinase
MLWALLVFGLLLIFDIALFGVLIFRSLSEREVEKILLETEGEMQTLAQKIATRAKEEGGDLYTAVAIETETLVYIDSLLQEREIFKSVQIRDKDGLLVWQNENLETQPTQAGDGNDLGHPQIEVRGPGDPELSPDLPEGRSVDLALDPDQRIEQVEVGRHKVVESLHDLEVPIQDLGSIQIGISQEEIEHRAEVLREELVRQVSVIGGVTLLLFFTGYLGIWFLLRRSRRLEEQAKEAERMAYIGTLASGLAHEIRNPLNSLNLNMQLLQEEMGDRSPTPSGPRLLGITRSEISRLERLVTDFLSYARPRPLELEEVTAHELLEAAEAMVVAEARSRNARIETEDRTAGLRFQVDTAQIRQLLLNLTHNALTSTEEVDREPVVRLSAARHGSHVVIAVRDNGVGIPPEQQSRIFDLFFSTRRGGTGLGLAIAQRIVKDHRGRIDIDSTPGEGTTVSVHLPLIPGEAAPAIEPLEHTA